MKIDNHITTREQYDAMRVQINELINEATAKGLLESDADNEYIREISRLATLTSDFEDKNTDLMLQNVK